MVPSVTAAKGGGRREVYTDRSSGVHLSQNNQNYEDPSAPNITDSPGLYFEDYVDKKSLGTTMETPLLEASTGQPLGTDPSIYSQLLWNSFLKKIDSSNN